MTTQRRSRSTRRIPRRRNHAIAHPPVATPRLGIEAGRRRWDRKIIAAIVVPIFLAFVGAIAGAVVTYVLAPQQTTRNESAVESAHEKVDASVPGVLVRGQRYGGELRSAVSSDELPVDALNDHLDQALESGSNLEDAFPPPRSVPVSPLAWVDDASVRQPRVYDTMFITLVGNHYRQVKITDISARILDRVAPPTGTLVYASPQGASPEESVGFDLDSNDLDARVTEEGTDVPHDTTRHYFDERQITLERFESLELKLSVFTRTCLCRFVFDITTDDGSVITANDDGSPWQVSAFAPGYAREYAVDVTGPPYIVPCAWPTDCQRNY